MISNFDVVLKSFFFSISNLDKKLSDEKFANSITDTVSF